MSATATLMGGGAVRPGTAAPIKQAAAKAAAPKAAAHIAAPVAQSAAKRYSGAYSGALNNLSDQEDRAHAVAARRQADADKYTAYVMGQQGSIAAAAQKQDQQTLGLDMATQGATLASQLRLQAGLGAGRAQQGITGPVPLQQSAGLVNDQQVGQALMGAVTQQQADKTNTNAGKAQFLQAAAQAGLLANKRAIAGDEYNQVSDIGAQRTNVLTTRTQSAQADKRAAASAAASNANAELAHEDRLTALEQQSTLAADNRANSNAQLSERLTESARQGHANRVVRLKTAATSAAAGGYVTPREQRRRTNLERDAQAGIDAGKQRAAQLKQGAKAAGIKLTPELLRHAIVKDHPKMPKEVQDYVLAATFGHLAGVTKKGQPSAAARYTTYLKKVRAGEL